MKNCMENYKLDGTTVLSDLPIGSEAAIIGIVPQARCSKKFADVGIVKGMQLVVEGKSPFGKLLRIKILRSSLALHSDDAENVMVKVLR